MDHSGSLLLMCLCFLFIGNDIDAQSDAINLPSVCKSHCTKNINETETATFCKRHGLLLLDRCCVNNTQPQAGNKTLIVGIDLQNCSMTETLFSAGIRDMNSLQYISLEGNIIKEITNQDFHRNTGIVYLSLPPNLQCPGGSDAWSNNQTTSSATICRDELNPCQVHNVTCPDNSHCVPSGVDLTECLCDEGYYGYKCLNSGKFPTLPFVLGVAVPTVILCGLLWFTQRRYVINKNK